MRSLGESCRGAAADGIVWACAALVLATLGLIVTHVLWSGIGQVGLEFLLEAPRKGGRAGGIAPCIVSTLVTTGVALIAAVPIALGIALLLSEYVPPDAALARHTRTCLGMLAAVPSIVFGLVGNALFCDWLGFGFSLLAGGLTLGCMILPVVAWISEQSIRNVPEAVRRGAYALGMPRHRVVTRVLIPAAAPGIVAGVALGFGRAVAESAALIFTSGYVDRMPGSIFDSGRTLAVHILDMSMNVPGGDARAYATATVLMISILSVVGVLAFLDHLSRRQSGYAS